jgi:hypothetical protein
MSWLNNISLKAKMGLIVGIGVVGISLFGWVAYTTLETVKIGGPLYVSIFKAQDAVADVLPPDGNLLMVDWFYRKVVNNVAIGDYDHARRLYTKYKAQREAFTKIVEKWQPETEVYGMLPFETPEVKRYLQLLETKFEPAFERNDWKAVTDPKAVKEILAAIDATEPLYERSIARLKERAQNTEQSAIGAIKCTEQGHADSLPVHSCCADSLQRADCAADYSRCAGDAAGGAAAGARQPHRPSARVGQG